jgi:two-component system sensor histidine kinase UhpB
VLLGLDDLAAHAPSELRGRIGEVQEIARLGLDEVRAVARRLRPDVLEDLGLPSALAAQAAQFTELTGIPVRRRIELPLPTLNPGAELAIYRVVQESFTNVARHAAARSVDLTVVSAGEALVVSVADDGKGMPAGGNAEGGGIRGMRERALLVNGRLDVRSVDGTGVAITLTVPLDTGA